MHRLPAQSTQRLADRRHRPPEYTPPRTPGASCIVSATAISCVNWLVGSAEDRLRLSYAYQMRRNCESDVPRTDATRVLAFRSQRGNQRPVHSGPTVRELARAEPNWDRPAEDQYGIQGLTRRSGRCRRPSVAPVGRCRVPSCLGPSWGDNVHAGAWSRVKPCIEPVFPALWPRSGSNSGMGVLTAGGCTRIQGLATGAMVSWSWLAS